MREKQGDPPCLCAYVRGRITNPAFTEDEMKENARKPANKHCIRVQESEREGFFSIEVYKGTVLVHHTQNSHERESVRNIDYLSVRDTPETRESSL